MWEQYRTRSQDVKEGPAIWRSIQPRIASRTSRNVSRFAPRGSDWQSGALLPRELNGAKQVVPFRRQFPRGLRFRVHVPEVEPEGPDVGGRGRLRDPSDERVAHVIRSSMCDHEACIRGLHHMNNASDFARSGSIRESNLGDIAHGAPA